MSRETESKETYIRRFDQKLRKSARISTTAVCCTILLEMCLKEHSTSFGMNTTTIDLIGKIRA